LAAQEGGKFTAECIDAVFKALIEHVANHDHSALRPLTHASKIRVSEMSLGAIAEHQRVEQGLHGVAADGMALRQVIDNPKSVGSEFLHRYRLQRAGTDGWRLLIGK